LEEAVDLSYDRLLMNECVICYTEIYVGENKQFLVEDSDKNLTSKWL
jgi:hypothetical protein